MLLFVVLFALEGYMCIAPEEALLKHLLKDYDVDARPSPSVVQAVNVTYDIALRQMLDLDEKQQIMTTSVWVRQYWADPYLVWNASDWFNISYVAVAPDRIWKPDITLYNNAEREFQGFDDVGKTRINVYSNGFVAWLIPMILRSECKLDMVYFPFDKQKCPLQFGSWALDGLAMDFWPRNPIGDLSSFSKSGEFHIHGLEANRVSTLYGCCPNPYVTITYTMTLERRVKFYFYNLIIPGILIAALSCFSFFLPPLSGERTSLIITNFLSLSVYVLMVSDSIPPSSDSVPALVRFYTVMVSEIAIALVLNCIIIPLAVKRVPVPRIVRIVCIDVLAKFILCRKQSKISSEIKKGGKINQGNEDFFQNSVINDEVIFENNNVKAREVQGYIPRNYSNDLLNFLTGGSNKNQSSTNFEKRVLEYIDSKHEIMSQEKKIEDDWHTVVMVLDRLFFFIFLMAVVISALVIILDNPSITL